MTSFVFFAKTFDALTGNEMVFLSNKMVFGYFFKSSIFGEILSYRFPMKKVLLHLFNLNVEAVTGVFNIAYGFTF